MKKFTEFLTEISKSALKSYTDKATYTPKMGNNRLRNKFIKHAKVTISNRDNVEDMHHYSLVQLQKIADDKTHTYHHRAKYELERRKKN